MVRTDEIVLYDSVKRDGGAMASNMFWVLDTLGHPKVRALNGGIDAWKRTGYEAVGRPETREAALCQARSDEIRLKKLIIGDFIQKRLGDPTHQIIDVRFHGEHAGEKETNRPGRDHRVQFPHLRTAGLLLGAAAGEGRMDAVFALLGGLCGAAVFAHLHPAPAPLLYAPTNVGQITLADAFGNKALAVVIPSVGFGCCVWGIGRIWGRSEKSARGATAGDARKSQFATDEADSPAGFFKTGICSESRKKTKCRQAGFGEARSPFLHGSCGPEFG